MRSRLVATVAALALATTTAGPQPAAAATLPAGFQDTVVLRDFYLPTVVDFSNDGRIFVGEKSGIIKVFDSLADSTPDIFADLRTNVHNFWDRGLLGMALAPDFPNDPSVYVMYTYDHILGDPAPAPRWGVAGDQSTSDPCPTPPGATSDGCVVSGRLSRLTAAGGGNSWTGSEQVLVEDWCQQYPSHSIGSLAFGPTGALYVSGGDGASFTFADYGQAGSPSNPCGDPPSGKGSTLTPPTAEGGALRSLDLRTSGDPLGFNGAILRLDPATGAGWPANPLANSSDPNARRIIAQGLRNPFRMTVRPGTHEVWTGDVGWATWEEINRIADPGGSVENFGWPCYEGTGRQPAYDSAGLAICASLYAAGTAAHNVPYYTYRHGDQIVSGESCANGQGSSVVGLAFYEGGPYPAEYDGALFFGDYSRDCIWVMFPGAGGLPDPQTRRNFVTPASNPVDLKTGPNGDLFYIDFENGTLRRITYASGNQPPVAVASAQPASGAAPLTVQFDGTASSDPDGDALTYGWDLDGDGAFDDAGTARPTWTYQAGTYQARLQVTDSRGGSATSSPIVISAGNTAPSPVVDTPTAGATWAVGQVVSFSGHASDGEQGTLPPSALRWDLVLLHCPESCHEHPITSFTGVASGSFVAPDHDYPSSLALRLTATDAGGLSRTVERRLEPRTVVLRIASEPTGLQLTAGPRTATAPFDLTAIERSTIALAAPMNQSLAGQPYGYSSWSDGGAASHSIVAASSATFTATYAPATDLAVTQNASVNTPSSRVVFTIVVTNQGPLGVTSAVLTDALPSALTFDAARSTAGCSAAGTTVTCGLGSLATGSGRTVTIAATFATKAKGNVDNTVRIRSERPDPDPSDDTSTIRVRLR